MTCRSARKLLSRRISGPLPGGDGAALERHLASCTECRREQARLEGAWRALDALGAPGAAPDDWDRIEGALDRGSRWWEGAWTWDLAPGGAGRAWVLAGMIVIGAGGGVLISRPLLVRTQPGPVEARAFAETLGDLPWDSPAVGLDRAFAGRAREEGTP